MSRLPSYGAFRHEANDMVTAASFGGSASFTFPAGLIGGNSAGWSWAGWFWPNTSADRNIVLGSQTNSPTFGYSSTNRVQFQLAGGATFIADLANTFAIRRWIHGAVSITPLPGNVGFDWVIYQLGEVVGSGRAATGTFVAHTTAPAGSLGSGSRLGRQTLWARGITQAEVRAHYYAGKSGGAVADWPVNESVGAVSNDAVTGLVGRQLAITLGSGGFWTADTAKKGPFVQREFGSILLPGAGGANVQMAADSALQNLVGATEITLTAWSKPRTGGNVLCARSGASPTTRLLFASGVTSGGGSAAMLDGETLRTVSSQQPFGEPIPIRGQWRQQAITFRPADDQIDYFINGALVSRTTADFNGAPFSLASATNKLTIGEDPDGGGSAFPFAGWIGPVEIYDSPLTLAQIRQRYLSGTAGVTPAYRWAWQERAGTTAASTGSKYSLTGTLQAGVTWSLDQPW